MSLRGAVTKLSNENAQLRPHLQRILTSTSGPTKGDTVKLMHGLGPDKGRRGDEFLILDIDMRFTIRGPKQFVPVVKAKRLSTGVVSWFTWSWFTFQGPPNTTRKPEDDALKVVLRALGPLKKLLRRTTGERRGTRTLEPKGHGRVTIPFEDVAAALSRSPEIQGSIRGVLSTEVQIGAHEFQTYKIVVTRGYGDATLLQKIEIGR